MTNVILGQPSLGGLPGQDGADGLNGASAYEIAVAAGFQGTEAQWLTSLEIQTGSMILAKAGQSFAGFLECDGSIYGETNYPRLAALGYSFYEENFDEVIDLGGDGQLILPVSVGNDVYYYWDKNKNGYPQDYTTLSDLTTQFNSGLAFDGTERTATLNGIDMNIPVLGINDPVVGATLQSSGSYTGLAALWQEHGRPAGWGSQYFASVTPAGDAEPRIWRISLYNGTVDSAPDGWGIEVAVRVHNPPSSSGNTIYQLPDSADFNLPEGYSYYIKY